MCIARRISLTVALTAAALAFVPAADAQGKRETVKIYDFPGSVGNMLYRVAIAKGYCEKHGITCQLQNIPSAALATQGMLAKSIDAGLLGAEVQINAMNKGAKLKAIHAGTVLGGSQLVVSNDLPRPGRDKGNTGLMQDLKGKKIGVTGRGSALEFLFVMLAQAAGQKAEDYTFVAVGGPATAYGALTSKQVDANMTFEPHGSMCDVQKTCTVAFRAHEAEEPPSVAAIRNVGSNIVVTQETIDTRPHVVDAMIAAAKDAEAFIQDGRNFDEVVKIARDYYKLEMPRGDEIFTVSLKAAIPFYKSAINRKAMQSVADMLLATKQIETAVDATTMIYEKAP